MADENLKVSKEKLGAWGFDMATYSVDATSDAFADVRLMEGAALHAFMGANQSGGVFAEGAVMHAGIERQAAAFNAFLTDLTRGIQAIGYAANVMSHAYDERDVLAAEKMNVLAYAFADPGVAKPAGVPKNVKETMLDGPPGEQQSGLSEAELGGEGTQTISVGGGYLTLYADGSTRMTRTETQDGVPRSVTTITNPAGVLIGTTTVGYAVNPKTGLTGENYRRVVTPGATSTNAEGKKVKAPDHVTTTKTDTAADGSKTITTEIKTGDEVTERNSVFVPAPAEPDPERDGVGPVQEAQETFPGVIELDWRKGYQHQIPAS